MGVDVFFVISGYLITSFILAEMDEDKFSLITFYERRVRRILPALFFVMLVSIPFAWLWLTPQDMRDFALSLVAVSTFWSNILFWLESGYFATEVDLKPLLHTWSLAVEEQYYILFPLFLMLTWRLGKSWILRILIAVFVVSLVIGHWGAYNKPDATFYLLPTRGWEILIGAFIVFYLRERTHLIERKYISQSLSLVGLSLIAYAVFVYDKHTPFPSLYALVPTVGTAFVILFAHKGTFVNSLLSNKIFIGIGLISYSAYLWHQPLFALIKYRSHTDPSGPLIAVLCLITLSLAYLSWQFVEKPFRQRQKVSKKVILFCSTAFVGIFVSIGLVGYAKDVFKDIWLAKQPAIVQQTYFLLNNEVNNFGANEDGNQDNGLCRFNIDKLDKNINSRILDCYSRFGSGIALLGDSHAIDLYGAVISSNSSPFIIGITKAACRPHTPRTYCQYDSFYNFVKENPNVFAGIVYEQAAFYLLRTKFEKGSRGMLSALPFDRKVEGVEVDKDHVTAVYDYLKKLSKYINVVWFGSRIEPHFSDRMILQRGCDFAYVLRPGQRRIFDSLDAFISALVEQDNMVGFVSQNEALQFTFPRDFMSCDVIYWFDGDHLSAEGEKRFGARFDIESLLTHAPAKINSGS